jgi:Rad3-related DNA helicase
MRGEPGGLRLFEGRHLAIHDEAHLLEPAIRGMMKLRFNREFYQELGVPLPRDKDYDNWLNWCHRAMAIADPLASEYESEAKKAARDGRTLGDEYRLHKRAHSAMKNLEQAAFYVLPHRPFIQAERFYVELLPIWGAPYAKNMLWNKAEKHLLMSATLLQPKFIARSLGLEDGEWISKTVPSPFHHANRRVLDVAEQKITYKSTPAHIRQQVEQLDRVLDKHPEHRGIIHTVSYQRARDILSLSRHAGRMVSHTNERGQKEAAIEQYLATPGAVFLSPSVAVGEDFGKGDSCRFQVFVKYPIPNTSDPIVAARREEDPNSMWFEADMAFVQSVGRGMRSEDDWCINYLLDAGARWRFGHLPKWFQAAIVRSRI